MEKIKRRSSGSGMGSAAAKESKRLRMEGVDDGAYVGQAMAAKKSRIEPNIIYAVSPRLYHADPSNFSSIVQILTGCAETRSRCKDVAILEEILDGDPQSPRPCGIVDSPGSASSPCSSISSSTASAAAAAPAASLLQEIEASDRSSGQSGSVVVTMAEDEVNWRELLQEISSPSTSWSSGSLILDESQLDCFYYRDSAVSEHAQFEQHDCFADTATELQPANHPASAPCYRAQGMEATFTEMCFQDFWLSPSVQDDYSSNSSISGYDSLSL